jgi:hypothetical protein
VAIRGTAASAATIVEVLIAADLKSKFNFLRSAAR